MNRIITWLKSIFSWETRTYRAVIANGKKLDAIADLLKRISGSLNPVTAWLAITDLATQTTATFPLQGVTKMPTVQKDDTKGVSYAFGFKDAKGNDAAAPTLPSPPTWSEDSAGALCTLTPAADGMSAAAVPTGKVGVVNVTAVLPASADGSFAGATGVDALQIVADVATAVELVATPIS